MGELRVVTGSPAVTMMQMSGHTGIICSRWVLYGDASHYILFVQELARLKVDKLELLRQNVAAQREVKRLWERETQLSEDLGLATREITRLR